MAVQRHRENASVQPAIEPVTVDEARQHCDLDDAYYDSQLAQLVNAARVKVEQDTRLALINQTRELRFDDWPGNGVIELPVAPAVSVSSVTYVDTGGSTQTVTAADYIVDVNTKPGRIVLGHGKSWPSCRGHYNDIVVTYVAGHGEATSSVPEMARLAIFMLVRHWFDNGTAVSKAFAQPTVMPLAYQSLVNALHWGQYP